MRQKKQLGQYFYKHLCDILNVCQYKQALNKNFNQDNYLVYHIAYHFHFSDNLGKLSLSGVQIIFWKSVPEKWRIRLSE